ncbi:hypothetical protein QAD02_012130 [Eretmocerus hayati]|uniref:Uncharacterized protein n=1 Tax=Eretmocerus hayati TaxID=131215 RepID=A0ACC2NYS5_9HYME|nr:hypothetical protein QAD02_012130 [Eretmocerus hayati]
MTSAQSINFIDVEMAVCQALNDSQSKLIDFTIEPLSKQWGGMMGAHFSLSAKVSQSSLKTTETINNTSELKFFAKTPPPESSSSKDLVDDRLNPEEVHFFQKVYPRMKGTQKWSPRCHFASNQLLIFEDLRLKDFAIRTSGLFDEASLKAAVETLASFHASSIVLQAEIGSGNGTMRLDEAYPGAFQEKIFYEGHGKCARANRVGFKTLEKLARYFGLDASLVPKILCRLCETVRPREGQCNVICHGDLWRSNIMFADGSSNFPSCLLVDYQMLRYASPALDLAMLLYVHTEPNLPSSVSLRNAMLVHYEKCLHDVLAGFGVEDFFSEDVVKDFDRCRLLGAAQASTRWPPVVFNSVMKDPVAFERWYFHERFEVYREYMELNPDYESMMKEYLIQLIDEGKRVLEII